jgi:hypothetical protein
MPDKPRSFQKAALGWGRFFIGEGHTRRRAFNQQGGLRPIVGQTQELLPLLFGPSPGGPPEGNLTLASCVHSNMWGHTSETIRTATIRTMATASAEAYRRSLVESRDAIYLSSANGPAGSTW